MSRFKLICEDEAIPFGGSSKFVHEFETEELFHILANVTNFLQKSGYLDDDKHLTLERDVVFDDLDEFTEKLFTGTPIPKE